jgi:hypothetical protein
VARGRREGRRATKGLEGLGGRCCAEAPSSVLGTGPGWAGERACEGGGGGGSEARPGAVRRAVLSACGGGRGRNGTRDEQLISPRFLLVAPLSLPFSSPPAAFSSPSARR